MALSQITPTLFLSGADGPLNQALVSRKGITLIVNATVTHPSPVYPGVECVRVPVSDIPSARLSDHFDRVADRIHGNWTGGTLVHCVAGMSRSPALVMAYLMRHRGVNLRQAHSLVQESRPYVRLNAGFWAQLLEYERRLYGTNTVRVAEAEEPLQPEVSPHTISDPEVSPHAISDPEVSPHTISEPALSTNTIFDPALSTNTSPTEEDDA
ncbi:dual specificity protein phosphatase 18 [Aplochiton taeniatus]